MKKLALLIVTVGIVGLSSCTKNSCKTCSFSTTNYEVCNDGITHTVNGVKVADYDLGSKTKEEHISNLETDGYTCK